jgi:hypothetical protein
MLKKSFFEDDDMLNCRASMKWSFISKLASSVQFQQAFWKCSEKKTIPTVLWGNLLWRDFSGFKLHVYQLYGWLLVFSSSFLWVVLLWVSNQLKPHCIQFSQVLVPAGTSRYVVNHFRPGQTVTRVMAYVANAVTLWRWLQQCVPAALRALTWSTLNWLNRIQCGFKVMHSAFGDVIQFPPAF